MGKVRAEGGVKGTEAGVWDRREDGRGAYLQVDYNGERKGDENFWDGTGFDDKCRITTVSGGDKVDF